MDLKRFLMWPITPHNRIDISPPRKKAPQPLFVSLLEERCVLDASFDGTGGVIALEGFEAGSDLTISQSGTDYLFELPATETWNGSDIGGDVVGNGTDTLTVRRNFAVDITVSDSLGNDPDISFGATDFVQGSGSDDVVLTGVGQVTQTAEITVDFLTINGATLVTLDDAANDFDTVTITATGNTAVGDANDLNLGVTSITGDLAILANDDISQSGSIDVTGSSTLQSVTESITLTDGSNTFSGSVGVSVANDATLHAGSDVQLDASFVGDDLALNIAGNVTQSDSLSVAGNTSLTATGSVTLNTHSNDLDGPITLAVNATSDVAIRNDNASASFGSISTLNDFTISHTASSVSLAGVTVNGNLAVTSSAGISQTGDWSVLGTTTLDANGVVNLDRNNTLQQSVSITNSGLLDTTVKNDHASAIFGAIDVGGDFDVNASFGNVTQIAAWQVVGNTSVSAPTGSLTLADGANQLGGDIVLNASGAISIANSEAVSTFGSISTSGSLTVLATGDISQSDTWTIDGVTSVTATGDISLTDNNVLRDAVSVDTTGDATLTNTHSTTSIGAVSVGGDFTVVGTASGVSQSAIWQVNGATNVNVDGVITLDTFNNELLGDISLSTTADALIRNNHTTTTLWAVDVDGSLVVTASNDLSQTAAWTVDGTTTLTSGGSIDADNFANVLQGTVTLTATGDAAIENNMTTSVYGALDVDGDLTIDAANDVTQTSIWQVDGTADVNAGGTVSLGGLANVLQGAISLNTLDDVTIQNSSVTTTFGASTVVGNLTINATSDVDQTGAMDVTGVTNITAGGGIDLDGAANDFDGLISVTSTTDASIRNTNNPTTFSTVSVGGDFSVLASGNVNQTFAWSVNGTTTVNAGGGIALGSLANNLQSTVSLTSVGNTTIRNVHASTVFGTVNSGGDFDVEVLGDITQTNSWSVTGTTTLDATGNVALAGFSNSFSGNLIVDGVAATTVAILNTSNSPGSYSSINPLTDLAVTHTQADVTVNAINLTNNLQVTTTDAVIQGGLWVVAGSTTIDAGGNIDLDSNANDFSGDISLTSGGDSSLQNVHSTSSFTNIDSSGALNLDVVGNITQSSVWQVGGASTLITTGDVVLGGFDNELDGDVSVTGVAATAVTIRNATSSAGVAYSLGSSISQLTITHTQSDVSVNGATIANDLSITTSGSISQGGDWTVGGNTDLDVTLDGSISLAASANDLTGPVTVIASGGTIHDLRIQNVNPLATVVGVPAALDNLEIIHPTASVLIPVVSVSGDLIISSLDTIQAAGELNVGGSATFTVNQLSAGVELAAHSHTFDGNISIVGAGGIDLGAVEILNDSTAASVAVDIANSTSSITLDFANTNVSLDSIDTDSLSLVADSSIGQSGFWDVSTSTNLQIGNAGTIDLQLPGNLFGGTLTFLAPAASNLHYRNAIGSATVPTLPTDLIDLSVLHTNATVTLPQITLSGDLAIESKGSIQQTGVWDVTGQTSLTMTDDGDLILAHANNLVGSVTIVANSPVSVGTLTFHNGNASANLLGLPNQVTNLTIDYGAATLALPAVDVTSNLAISSHGTISQTGNLVVGGSSSFTLTNPGDVILDQDNEFTSQAPTFSGTINHLHLRDILPARTLPALAGINQLTIDFEASSVALPALTLTGALDVSAGGNVTQVGVLNVNDVGVHFDQTGDLLLASFSNTIDGNVNISGNARDVALQNNAALPSFPNISLAPSVRDLDVGFESAAMSVPSVDVSGNLSLTANGDVTQSGEINADSLNVTTIATGANIVLTNASNTFASAVNITTPGSVPLSDVALVSDSTTSTVLSISGGVDDLVLTFDGELDLPLLSANTLTITSDTLTQRGAFTVGTNVSIAGIGSNDIQLGVEANDVGGTVSFSGSLGDIAFRNRNSGAITPTLPAAVSSLILIHDDSTIQLPEITVAGNLTVESDGTISQAGQLTVGGATTLTLSSAGDISLADHPNDFVGGLTLTGDVDVLELHNTNSSATVAGLPTNVDKMTLIFDAAGVALPAVDVTNDLTLTVADSITQTGAISVGGDTIITLTQPADVLLGTSGNNLAGSITIDGSIQDVSISNASLTAMAPSLNATPNNYSLVHDAVAITLSAMEVNGNLSITSHGTIDQIGIILVHGDSTFLASAGNSSIQLQSHANELDGAISVGVAGIGTLQDVRLQNIVAGPASFNAPNGLRDLELVMSAATSLDLGGMSITGDLDATADGNVTHSGVLNVAGTSTFTSLSGAILLNAHDNDLPVITYSTPDDFLLASSSSVQLSGTSARINVVADGDIGSTALTTTDVSGIASFTTQGGADINLASVDLAGGLVAETLSSDGSTIAAADIFVSQGGTLRLDSIRTAAKATLDSNAAIESNVAGTNIIAADAVLSAASGIGAAGRIDVAIDALTATTTSGNIVLDNIGGDLAIKTVTASAGTVDIESDSGSIFDFSSDGVTDIEAANIRLVASTGVGASSQLEVSTQTLHAHTDTGNVDLVNDSGGAVSLSNLSSGTDDVHYQQIGGFALTIQNADATAGNIDIITDGQITAVDLDANDTASLKTTGSSRNIIVENVLATNIDVSATGSINGDVAGFQLFSSSVDLTAGKGIGNFARIGVTAQNIQADTTSGGISLASDVRGVQVNVSGLTADSGDIDFRQNGASRVLVAGTEATSGNIEISTTSELQVINVQAGNGDASLTTTSGDVAVGFLSVGDVITINTAGGIRELVNDANIDIVAEGMVAVAGNGLGATNRIETNIRKLEIAAGGGNVLVSNTGALRLGGFSNLHGISTSGVTDIKADSIVVGKGILSSGGNNVSLSATNGGLSIYDRVEISGGLGVFKGDAKGQVIVSGTGTIVTQTGSVTAVPSPVVATAVDQEGSTISATGEAEIVVRIDDNGTNYKITVDWQDGISEEENVVGGTSYSFQHTYSPDLNIDSTVDAIVTIEPDFRDGAENGIQFESTSQELGLSKKVPLDPPSQGIIGSVGVLVNEASIIVSDSTPVATPPNALLTSIDTVQTVEVSGGSSVSVSAPEKQLMLRVVSPSGDEGEDISLSLADLDDLPSLYERLPDNRYRIYLVMEDGNARLIVDVQLRGGQPVDPSATEDEQPERPAGELLSDQSNSNEAETKPVSSDKSIEATEEDASNASTPLSAAENESGPNDISKVSAATATVAAGSTLLLRNKRTRAIRRIVFDERSSERPQPSFLKSARRLRSIQRG